MHRAWNAAYCLRRQTALAPCCLCTPHNTALAPLPPAARRLQSMRHTHTLAEGLQSVWDWEPPAREASGAWHILRQLALTANK